MFLHLNSLESPLWDSEIALFKRVKISCLATIGNHNCLHWFFTSKQPGKSTLRFGNHTIYKSENFISSNHQKSQLFILVIYVFFFTSKQPEKSALRSGNYIFLKVGNSISNNCWKSQLWGVVNLYFSVSIYNGTQP